jgi:hypothetical protein
VAQWRWSVLGPHDIGNRRFSSGTSGHDGYGGPAGPSSVAARTTAAEYQGGGGFESHPTTTPTGPLTQGTETRKILETGDTLSAEATTVRSQLATGVAAGSREGVCAGGRDRDRTCGLCRVKRVRPPNTAPQRYALYHIVAAHLQ